MFSFHFRFHPRTAIGNVCMPGQLPGSNSISRMASVLCRPGSSIHNHIKAAATTIGLENTSSDFPLTDHGSLLVNRQTTGRLQMSDQPSLLRSPAVNPSSNGPGSKSTLNESKASSLGCLSSSELMKEAQLARLSGLCYLDWDKLKAEAQKEGFTVVAGGDTFFTRWFVAKGRLTGGAHAAHADVTIVRSCAASSACRSLCQHQCFFFQN